MHWIQIAFEFLLKLSHDLTELSHFNAKVAAADWKIMIRLALAQWSTSWSMLAYKILLLLAIAKHKACLNWWLPGTVQQLTVLLWLLQEVLEILCITCSVLSCMHKLGMRNYTKLAACRTVSQTWSLAVGRVYWWSREGRQQAIRLPRYHESRCCHRCAVDRYLWCMYNTWRDGIHNVNRLSAPRPSPRFPAQTSNEKLS